MKTNYLTTLLVFLSIGATTSFALSNFSDSNPTFTNSTQSNGSAMEVAEMGGDCLNDVLFPFEASALDGTNDIVEISTCNFAGEYSEVSNAIAGNSYAFEGLTPGTLDGFYITVRSGTADGPVIGAGFSPVLVVAIEDGSMFAHWSVDATCEISEDCIATSVQCFSCESEFDCPELGANIGDACDDADAGTENDMVTADCNCEGTPICSNPFPAVDELSLSTVQVGNAIATAWDAVPGQIGCQIQVRLAGGSVLGARIVSGADADGFNIPFGALDAGTDYEWRVRCGCSQTPLVAGPFSSWQPFSTPGGASIASSPNPTAGPSNVTFTVVEEGTTTLEVFDMNGRMVEAIFTGVAQPNNEYRFQFDGSGLPNGVYIYRLTTQGEMVNEKFMIAQ